MYIFGVNLINGVLQASGHYFGFIYMYIM